MVVVALVVAMTDVWVDQVRTGNSYPRNAGTPDIVPYRHSTKNAFSYAHKRPDVAILV